MTSILSTAYFPPVEYFYYINRCENAWIDGYENYQKQTYRNRCVIYSPNGPLSLVIPVIRPDKPKTLVKDILISYDEDWIKTHWRSITTAYNTSPFFLFYKDDIIKILEDKYKYLYDLNNKLLSKLTGIIGIETNIFRTNKYIDQTAHLDLRNAITPKKSIHTKSQGLTHANYTQVFEAKYGFIPNLSIIDLLFNEGPNTLNYLEKIK